MLQNIGQNVTVMAGDFNCTLKPKYDRASQVESHKHSSNLLRDLVKELQGLIHDITFGVLQD